MREMRISRQNKGVAPVYDDQSGGARGYEEQVRERPFCDNSDIKQIIFNDTVGKRYHPRPEEDGNDGVKRRIIESYGRGETKRITDNGHEKEIEHAFFRRKIFRFPVRPPRKPRGGTHESELVYRHEGIQRADLVVIRKIEHGLDPLHEQARK